MKLVDYTRFDNPEEQFMLDYPFAWDLLRYVESIRGEDQLFLKSCAEFNSGLCSVDFVSYNVPGYENFRLVVSVTPTASNWEFSVSYQNTTLS